MTWGLWGLDNARRLGMPGQENPRYLYHHTGLGNRDSILRDGLSPDHDQTAPEGEAGEHGGAYATDVFKPGHEGDVWRIDTAELPAPPERDWGTVPPEDENWYFIHGGVPPHALTLHHPHTAARLAMPWYHNTDAELNPGDELLPPTETGHKSQFADADPEMGTIYHPDKVYFYNHPTEPTHEQITDQNGPYANAIGFGKNTYQVEPIGHVERDPEWQTNREKWEGYYDDENEIPGYYDHMAPRARVVRKVEPRSDPSTVWGSPEYEKRKREAKYMTAARLAMPAIDAYDSDQVWRNPAPAVPHGPWYHGSPHQLPEGTVLTPGGGPAQWPDYYRGGGGTRAKRPDWLWLSPDPHQASTWGRYVYEVHPHGDGPWPWNGPDAQQHDGINRPDGYVVPKAHVVRMVHPDEYDVPSENELNAEQDFDGDFDDMLADYQHNYYTRKARTMTAAITVYTKPNCPQCTMTKKQLDRLGVEHQTVDVTTDPDAHAYVTGLGYQQAPVVVVNDGERHWGGFSPDKLKGLVE